jgi:PTH1 family peptidyl-tRNA hydrolase
MEFTIVGLGNPGSEYEETRHNIGRIVVESLAKRWGTSDWRDDKKLRAKISQGTISKGVKVTLVLPDNYMNRSGGSVAPLIPTSKKAESLVVVHDDIDIGLGTLRVVFNRGSGGHLGVESIEKVLKTKAYIRVRVGVVGVSPSGKLKKPKGEHAVYDFILKKLSKKEKSELEEMITKAGDAVETIVLNGREEAMRVCNTSAVLKKSSKKIALKK